MGLPWPQWSYASEEHKKTGDFQSPIKANSEVDKTSSSQKIDQDNLCNRGDDCQQANEGQQTTGKDNEVTGFNDQSALASVNNTGQPGPQRPECPGGFKFNESTQKCERPACTDGFAFNAGTQQCERPTTTQAICPDGNANASATCPGTSTSVPVTCSDGFTGPNSTGYCRGTVQRIGVLCPAPIGATNVVLGPYINGQGQCEIVVEGAVASNYPNCFGQFSKTCMDGIFTCQDGFAIENLVTGMCIGTPITQATCPDGSAATSATCPITRPSTMAACPAGFMGPDATTGRCTRTETRPILCANTTSTGICQTGPKI